MPLSLQSIISDASVVLKRSSIELRLLNYWSPSFQRALFFIMFNPLFWNLFGRLEHRFGILTRIFGGNRHAACYFFSAVVFTLGVVRDELYRRALDGLRPIKWLDPKICNALAAYAFSIGNVLVLSSFYRLGITGTYLGDHFGILMKQRITDFPFNWFSHPMYEGSTLVFLSYALWKRSTAGLVLTAAVAISYYLAAAFEGPFTASMYAKKATKKAK